MGFQFKLPRGALACQLGCVLASRSGVFCIPSRGQSVILSSAPQTDLSLSSFSDCFSRLNFPAKTIVVSGTESAFLEAEQDFRAIVDYHELLMHKGKQYICSL